MKSLGLIFYTLLVVGINSFGQTIIRGKIKDSNGESMAGVCVYIKSNPKLGTFADFDGLYSLKLVENVPQTLVLSYIGYVTIEDTFSCKKGNVVVRNYVMKTKTSSMKEVVVAAKAYSNNDSQLEYLQKRSISTIDYISAETIKKTGDVTVSSAIARVSGVSTSSGGLITVRGIGDRYLKTTINNSQIPTLDPFTNNIKLDLFPATLIDNITITKTAQPDLPGDWAGAYISIETKDFPEVLSVSLESSVGYNTQATFKDVLSSQRSNTDWLGYDHGFREYNHNDYVAFNPKPTPYQEFTALGLGNYFNSLGVTNQTPWSDTYYKLGLIELGLMGSAQFDDPVAFQKAKDMYNTIAYKGHAFDIINLNAVNSEKALPNNWNTTIRKAPLSNSQSFSIGNQSLVFGRQLGYILGFRYSNSIQFDPNSIANKFTNSSKIINNKGVDYDSTYQKVSKETNGWSGLLKFAYKLNTNNSVSLLFMPNIIGVNNVRDIHYYGENNDGNYDIKKNQFYESRKQFVYQIKTENYFPDSKLKIEFNTSYTDGRSDAPDLKVVSYTPPSLSLQNNEPDFLATSTGTGRYYRYLTEKTLDARLSAELPLSKQTEYVRKLKIGTSFKRNKTQNDQYYYQLWAGTGSEYIVKANPNADPYGLDRFDIVTVIDPSTNLPYRSVQEYYTRQFYPTNNIFGRSSVIAGYLMSEYSLDSLLSFTGGLRLEKALVYTDCNFFDALGLPANDPRRSYEAASGIGPITVNPGKLNELSLLPSVNVVYKLNKQKSRPFNVRANYSHSIARPSIRELSDNAAYDYELNSIVRGNSMLKMVQINNYDLRFEKYFKSGDNISLSFFYKDFKNHIETVNFGGTIGFVWLNNKNTTWLGGIEIEGKKAITKNLEFRGNIAFVRSRSTFDKSYVDNNGFTVPGDKVTHTMLGQAPLIINAMLNYAIKKMGIVTSLNYNVQGSRLVINGTGPLPDIYERPRNLIDFKISKTLGKHFAASLKIQDILATATIRSYKVGNDYILDFDRYRFGTNYVVAVSYKL